MTAKLAGKLEYNAPTVAAIAAQGWRLVQVLRAQVANGEALEALARCGVRVEPTCPHSSGQTTEGNCARCGAKA